MNYWNVIIPLSLKGIDLSEIRNIVHAIMDIQKLNKRKFTYLWELCRKTITDVAIGLVDGRNIIVADSNNLTIVCDGEIEDLEDWEE